METKLGVQFDSIPPVGTRAPGGWGWVNVQNKCIRILPLLAGSQDITDDLEKSEGNV